MIILTKRKKVYLCTRYRQYRCKVAEDSAVSVDWMIDGLMGGGPLAQTTKIG